ncbi:DUF7344 domain-containing protein [Halosimplex sp. J119]
MPPADCYPDTAEAVDEVFDVLRHHLRREVINYFENAVDEPASNTEEIAGHIDSRLPDHVDGPLPDRDRTEIHTALVHVHLPKLESADWVEFDQRSGEVRYRGRDSAPELVEKVQTIFDE